MINHLLFLFFIINLFTSVSADDEVNTLTVETSPAPSHSESHIQPDLPQLNISYDATLAPEKNETEYLQSLLNIEKDGSTYCPLTEILTNILNELRNLLPQGGDKVKDVLSKYYTILENALNSKNSVEPLNKLSSENRFNYIDSLAQKIITMDDKNAKIKISIEYELPTMHSAICEKLCNDLIHFANSGNSPAINDLNYAYEQGKIKNNVMTYLQNYRPENINSNSSYYKTLKKYFLIMKEPAFHFPNADTHPSNPVLPNSPNSNLLQSLSQLLSNNSGTTIENLSTQFLESKGIYNYPIQNSIPMLQDYTGPSNSYPLQSLGQLVGISYNPIQTLAPSSQIPNGAPNSYSLSNLAPPLPNLTGNNVFLQNGGYSIGPEFSIQNPKQTLPPQQQNLKEKAKDIQNFANKKYADYYSNKNTQNYQHENQKQIYYNNGNAVQYLTQNNPTIVTPQKSENSWSLNRSQANYVSTNNNYNNNAKLRQEKLLQSYNQHKPVLNLVFEANNPESVNLSTNMNKNDLSGIKQNESGNLKVDLSSAQASSIDNRQNFESENNFMYPLTNPETGYLLHQQIPYSTQNIVPLSYTKNNALYNLFVKNYNQQATQSNTPNKIALNPSSYYYYNPNLGITNSAQNTQGNYGAQFKDLNRLLSVSNLDKLNFAVSKNGMVELMYKFNHSKSSKEPFFYVKYRIPYDLFLNNLNNLLLEQPTGINNLQLLYKDLLTGSNITFPSVSKSLDQEGLLKLQNTNGTLVTAKVLEAKNTSASDQIKIVQKLNEDMPLEDIVKTDPNITKVSNLTTNLSLINILRNRLNFLEELQKKIPFKKFDLNPFNMLANKKYKFQYTNYLANRKPTLGFNYFQNKPNNPYPSYGFNSFSRYNVNRG